MKFKYLKKIIINQNTSLNDVLEIFNKTAIYTEKKGFAIIVDSNSICVGVITEGDVRRSLIKRNSLESPVSKSMNTQYIFVNNDDSIHTILRNFDKRITNIPVLDQIGRPIDLYQYSKFVASTRAEEQIIRARVPVRVSYCGGGIDMTTYINKWPSFVLSSTINKYCTASIIIRDDDEIHITSKDLNLSYECKNYNEINYGDELDLIKAAIKIMQPQYGFELETYAEFEPGTGLGGSSAVVVSVLGAMNYFRNEQKLNLYHLSDLAYQVERIDMKINGGWQDQYATTFGGFSWIEFNKNDVLVNRLQLQREIILELEYNLMLFRLGGTRQSSKLQNKLINKIDINKNKNIINKINQLANDMKSSLLKGNVKKFADMLNESWIFKKTINNSVSNTFVDDCYNTAVKCGALGGKLLGAGQSGYLLIYASPLYQKEIKYKLENKGAKQEYFKFSDTGIEVWTTKR